MDHLIRTLTCLEKQYAKYDISILMESRTANQIPIGQAREVIHHLQKEHPLLNLEIEKKGDEFAFIEAENIEIPIQSTKEPAAQAISKWMNSPIGLKHLLQVLIIQKESGDIFFTKIHHSIADGISNFHLHDSFFIYLDRLMKGKPLPKPKPYPLPKPIQSLLPAHIKGLKREPIAKKWHQEIQKKAPLNLPGDFKNPEKKVIHRIELSLSPHETETLISKSKQNKASVNSTGIAALLATSAHFIETTEPEFHLSMDTPINLRPFLDPPLTPRHLAAILGGMHYEIPLSKPVDFWKVAKKIHQKTRKEFSLENVFKSLHAFDEIFKDEEESVFHYTSNLGVVEFTETSFKITEFGFHACCEVPFLFTFVTCNHQMRFFFIYTTPIVTTSFMTEYTKYFIDLLKKEVSFS